MSRFPKLDKIFSGDHPLRRAWNWAKGHGPKRWKKLFLYSRMKQRWNSKHHHLKGVRWWAAKRTVYRHKWKAAQRRHRQGHRVKFETWMLNGCPNTSSDAEKELIAFWVVECKLYISATSNGNHVSGSYHYYRPSRAVDAYNWQVSVMQTAMNKTVAKFGQNFRELFGPVSWRIKDGVRYPGMMVNHGDHLHGARNF